MPNSNRRLALGGAYGAMLQKLLPRLEELLFDRLQRLEAKLALHESRQGPSASARMGDSSKKPRRAVATDLGIGEPSVIVLGARLQSDRRYCHALILRAAQVVRAKLMRT